MHPYQSLCFNPLNSNHPPSLAVYVVQHQHCLHCDLAQYEIYLFRNQPFSYIYILYAAQTNSIQNNIMHETSKSLFYIYWRLQHPVQAVVSLHKFVSSLAACLPPAQFDSSDRPAKDETLHPTLTRQPQHPPTQQHQHLRQKSWTQKILRSSPPNSSSSETEACCVDPCLPLEKQR